MKQIAVVALASVVLAPAPVRTERTVPFKTGETLGYDVSWSTYLTAGTVTATVKEKKASGNSTAYYITAEGRPTPLLSKLYSLYYKLDTLIDVFTLLPQRGSVYSEEGRRHRYKTTEFDRASKTIAFEYKSDSIAKARFATSAVTQDALSALYVLRAIPLKAGDRMTMPVSDDGINYLATFDVQASERVKAPFGETVASRVRVSVVDDKKRPVGKNVALWISEDPRHLPVKLQADLPVGSFVLLLRDAR
jgi:hypothetical protein